MFDTIADMLRGSAPDDLAHALGTDRTQTRRAMEIGLPALITGLRDKTLEPGGAQNLSAMLENHDASLPEDIPAYLSEGDPSRGAAMLDVAFGDRGEPALASLADASGLSTRLLAQVMSVLAPIATGVLRNDAPGDADGLRSFLGSSVEDLEGKGFGRVVELVSPDLIGGGAVDAPPVVEVVDTAGPAELDVVVDDLGDGATVVQGAFPEPNDLDVQLSDIPEPNFESGLDAQVGSVPITPGTLAPPAGGDVVNFGADQTPVVEPKVDFDEGRGLSAMGWLWWLIGAILAVLVLLYFISQCGDDSGGSVATEGDETEVAATPTPDPLVAQRQATLDGIIVDYPGVTGTMVGEVAVLEGTVADLRTKALLDGAVRAASLGVQNNVEVDESVAAFEGFSLNDLIDAQPELSTLRSLLDQAGLGEALEGNGPFTLFAPTNDAFAAIQTDLAAVQDDPEALSAILQYHLLSGEQTGASIAQQQTLTSLTGEVIDVSVESGAVRLNDFVPVLVADAEARNGVMHVVSGVLTPPSLVPVPAELGSALELAPITFAAGSSNLADSSLIELDKVVAFLLETPVDVEIGGHTDSDGGEDGNLTLSQQRADAVKQYLTDQGVPAESLNAVGFGEASPVAPNDTSANKALNRRIEFITG